MKPVTIILLFYIHAVTAMSQKTNIYFLPGQGSDKRIFDSLKIDTTHFTLNYIEYGTPAKGSTMQSFARELSKNMDTTNEFILVGVSLGGMLCAEMNEFLNPKKVILISSAKNRKELPFRYKFQRVIPIYAIFPGQVLFAGAKILQPLVEPDRNKNKEAFKSMLYAKNPIYIKRTIRMIIKWERKTNTKKNYHVHGSNDHTLPLRKIDHPDHVIVKGSHMMTLTRAEEISKILNEALLN